MASASDPTLGPSRIDQWAARLMRLSRLVRIVLSLAITLEMVILASVVIDQLLIDDVAGGAVGRMTPALIAAAVGLVVYGTGWWALVGFDDDPRRPWRAGKPAVFFAAAGVVGLILLIALILFGLAFGYML